MVDDEMPLHGAVRRILDRYRFHVADVGVDVAYESAFFTSGEQFLESLAEGAAFDLLLLDLKLPGMSGLEILAALADQRRGMTVIMITAYATFETAVHATKIGAYDFLPKPFSPEELRYALRKATNQLILSREARRLAEEKRQVRFNFISVLAHELKAPISAVEGYLKILEAEEPPERLQMVDRSLSRLEGMKKLISDLLDLTAIESGQKQRNITTLDVRAAGRAAVDLFAKDAADRGIALELSPGGNVVMKADAGEIEMILNNLVSNAVKYNRDQGSATVSVVRKGEDVTISVADTGIGLTAEETAKLFTEFGRIKNDKTVKVVGSGLGLSTVKKLAHLYGGDATVSSREGHGSTFTVTLRDAAERSLERV